jgi:hypothetical protein
MRLLFKILILKSFLLYLVALFIFLYIIFTPFQSPAAQLTSETSVLMERALSGDPDTGLDAIQKAMKYIPGRPDWQPALNSLVDQIRNDPDGDNNNRCLIVESILREHTDDAFMDLRPLIPVLKTPDAFNQQKAAQVVEAVISRDDLVKQVEKELIQALILLTTSQRERVVRPALEALQSLTGQQSIGRNPEEWVKYFFSRFHEKIDLSNAVYELLVIVSLPDDDSGFIVDGKRIRDDELLKEEILAVKIEAERKNLQISLVVITDQDSIDFDSMIPDLLDRIKFLEPAVKAAGIKSVTFAPRTEKYYPIWKPSSD